MIGCVLIAMGSAVEIKTQSLSSHKTCRPSSTVPGGGISVGDPGSNGATTYSLPSEAVGGSSLPMQIISKPIARYTEQARESCIEGKVSLRIVFLSNGTLGKISVVKGLPAGLSQQAIYAARLIKFIPARRNGRDVSSIRLLNYNFTIY
jgi:TonB family protein